MTPTYIQVSAEVRYWDDATINGVTDEEGTLTPFREGDLWQPVIRLTDGVFMDWPDGMEARFHFKVCDAGEYWLLDESRQRVGKWAGYYVPNDFLCPEENGYGDYIIMTVGAAGQIDGWQEPGVEWVDPGDDESGWERLTDGAAEPDAIALLREVMSIGDTLVRDVYGSEFVARTNALLAKAA